MIERIQFWGVLLWIIGMLVLAAFAIRAVWFDASHASEEPHAKGAPNVKSGSNGSESDAQEPRPSE